ncbi:hypothetical protein HY798_04995 [Candidatus Falkowbacteria bacterium]|nr:hypothetical protein [Candidatus Falkowbacteria bacterium]
MGQCEPCIDFVGYEKKNGVTVARFRWYNGRKADFLKTREECDVRLENLQRQGLPHDQTLKAIKNWPKE